jgi:hypothetical protein
MTRILSPRFRPLVVGLGALLGASGLAIGLAGAASASTVPGYGHHQDCREVLTYDQEDQGYYGDSQRVEVDNVCFAVITHEGGGYGRHHHGDLEDVFYATQGRHGQERFHFVRDVRDAQVDQGYQSY